MFLPFTDFTSGDGSYGGGRYIDLKIPNDGFIVIDGTTTKQIPASDIKTYAGGVSTADATALAVALG